MEYSRVELTEERVRKVIREELLRYHQEVLLPFLIGPPRIKASQEGQNLEENGNQGNAQWSAIHKDSELPSSADRCDVHINIGSSDCP